MPTTIRTFHPADTDRVVELSLAAWEPVFASSRAILGDRLYRRVHPDWRTDQAASVRDALERHETWVATTDGVVTGFVNVVFDTDARSGEIYMIAVDPTAQRRGIATLLTDLALEEMRARGIDLAIVATGGDPGHAPARAAYEKAGFTGAPQVWYARLLTADANAEQADTGV
ncbi:MAG: GNAT family N-acetyltransferase [Acidimicrobiales bacterium]